MPTPQNDRDAHQDGGRTVPPTMASALDSRLKPHESQPKARRRASPSSQRRPLTPSHAMVLGASARALTEYGRSVALPEIVSALTEGEQRALLTKYPTQRLANAVLKIVAQLLTTARLVEVGRLGAHRYVATPEIQLAGLGGLPSTALEVQRDVPCKPAHELVRQALEIANVAAGRAVAIHEIVAALEPRSRAVLEDAYAARPLGDTVKKVVDLLCARGVVSSPGREGGARYYVAVGALRDDLANTLPDEPSRRARVAELVARAVERTGRAVRFVDVVEQARVDNPPAMSGVADAVLPDMTLADITDAVDDDPIARTRAVSSSRTPLGRHEIALGLQSLVRTGHLSTPYLSRGGAESGDYLYLPAGLAPAQYAPRAPLTWLDFVVETIGQLWKERTRAADAEARRPHPFTTAQLRDALQRRAETEPALIASLGLEERRGERSAHIELTSLLPADENVTFPAQAVANALQSLATGDAPVARRVIATAKSAGNLWAPAIFDDDALDIGSAFANDTARIAEAVRRACDRSAVPAVARTAVEEEVARDQALRPGGRRSVAQVLADAAKETLADDDGARDRVTQRVAHVGRVDTTVYYCALTVSESDALLGPSARTACPTVSDRRTRLARGASRKPDDRAEPRLVAAEAYVALRQVEHELRRLDLEATFAAIREIPLACVASGRAQLLAREIETLSVATESVRASVGAREVDATQAAELTGVLQGARTQATELAVKARDSWSLTVDLVRPLERGVAVPVLPDSVDVHTPGWTAAELLPHLTTLYPRSARAESPTELIALLSGRIRRVPNTEYVARREGGRSGAEQLFDQFAARVTIAHQWGGRHAMMLASIATETLGTLRDPRFVLPALWHHDATVRLAGIACVAYLSVPEAQERLADLARRDREAGLRAAAAWAYGFVGGPQADVLLADVLEDPQPLPRRLAQAALEMQPLNWWRL